MPRSLVRNYLASMVYRKVPLEQIIAKDKGIEVYGMSDSFRAMQAKWNVLKILPAARKIE
jgi:hypothetical protein